MELDASSLGSALGTDFGLQRLPPFTSTSLFNFCLVAYFFYSVLLVTIDYIFCFLATSYSFVFFLFAKKCKLAKFPN